MPEGPQAPEVGALPNDHLDSRSGDRLDSWKEIASYLKLAPDRTVRRWEKKREGLPVHRHKHNTLASV